MNGAARVEEKSRTEMVFEIGSRFESLEEA